MLQLLRCLLCLMILLMVFTIWGHSIAQGLRLKVKHLPMQILVGFFAYFIVMEVVILPLVFLYSSLHLVAILTVVITAVFTVMMLWKDKLGFLQCLRRISITPWLVIAVCVVGLMNILAILQPYMGYDTAYYVGEVNAFLYYDKLWTRDAFAGMLETTTIPLHYALSCFYPLCAVFSYLLQVDARLVMMFTIRALCVLLFACVTYSWGYGLFTTKSNTGTSVMDDEITERVHQRNGAIFSILCMTLCMFLVDDHSSSFMMMVRGYESKGYCAAVVAPMCTYALIMLCRDVESVSHWRLLGLVAWASMPIAMSSMAVIPAAIVIVSIVLAICEKKVGVVCKRAVLCILPNVLLMGWYVIGTYLPLLRG